MHKAVFLDRDGVLIEDVEYLDSLKKIQIIDGSIEAVRMLNETGFRVIVVTNQSGVARGYFPVSFVIQTHEFLFQYFSQRGATIDRFYFCPHHPEGSLEDFAIQCTCRKPAPGMLLRAQKDFQLDLNASYLIGDKFSDIEAALHAQVQPILVKTGKGLETFIRHSHYLRDHQVIVAKNLKDAVDKIIIQS
jgi:D-glycero-D-manno-heptose 1,7-bisphosphate phosphatase